MLRLKRRFSIKIPFERHILQQGVRIAERNETKGRA